MKLLGNTGFSKLIELIDTKFASKNSPTFTGTPAAPTATATTDTTQVATTAFVHSAINNDLVEYTDSEIETLWNTVMNS